MVVLEKQINFDIFERVQSTQTLKYGNHRGQAKSIALKKTKFD